MPSACHFIRDRAVGSSPRLTVRWLRPLAGLCLLSAGCSGNSIEAYKPPADKARGALEAALTAWQQGLPSKEVKVDETPLHILDSNWEQGKKLVKFEIVGEAESAGAEDAARRFDVQITVDDSPPEKITYHVVGQSPIMVATEQDFKKISGM